MMDGLSRRKLALNESEKIKTDYKDQLKGWTFEFCSKLKQLGTCLSIKKEIKIASYLLDKENPIEELLDTIRHEYAHALTPHHAPSHGKQWKKWAITLGATPRAKAQSKIAIPEHLQQKTRARPYVAICKSCGIKFTRCVSPGYIKRSCKCQRNLEWGKKEILQWTDIRTGQITNQPMQTITIGKVLIPREDLFSTRKNNSEEKQISLLTKQLKNAKGNKQLSSKIRRELRKLGHKGGLR